MGICTKTMDRDLFQFRKPRVVTRLEGNTIPGENGITLFRRAQEKGREVHIFPHFK